MKKVRVNFLAGIFKYLLVTTILLTGGGCSQFESGGTGSVIFRAAVGEEEGLVCDLSLKGGFEAEQTFTVKDGESLTFDNIPVGAEIWAEAVAYTIDSASSEKTILYRGKSDKIIIKEGENPLSLTLKKLYQQKINVTVISADDGIELTQTEEESKITFTAKTDSSQSFIWSIDGEAQPETSGTFVLETSGLSEGTYIIEVVCGRQSAAVSVKIGE